MLDLIYSQNIFRSPEDFSAISVIGADAFDFLNRQLTNDLNSLSNNCYSLSTRLDRNGRLHSFFYLLKKNQETYYIVCDKKLQDSIFEELNKFLIMEDLELSKVSETPIIYFGIASAKTILNEKTYSGTYLDLPAVICFGNNISYDCNQELFDFLASMTAWPILEKTVKLNTLVNETRLNELGVSYKKGCFLGQETISKIETRRGAAKYPTWIEANIKVDDWLTIENTNIDIISVQNFNERKYFLANLSRKFRVNQLEIDDEKILLNSPLGDLVGPNQSIDIYHKAIEKFHKNNIKEAIELLDIAIYLNPKNGDFFESKGAILGQNGKFEDAISEMDKLLAIEPDSVMAHTNKSLYLMKLGKIEEAEEEKSLATVASFKQLGNDAKVKKDLKSLQEREQAELDKRESMFRQVLEIDEQDDIANYGMADILYKKQVHDKSMEYLEVVLKIKPKYSQAYLLKGKNLEALKNFTGAIDIYKKGVKIAAEAGELMPANEMQSRLSALLK